ncbi:hypothetical protein [Solirubrobacter deserti]|uniref:Roadblock/LAMTOR2 domain-containing protein n=1 Tax=Solirubrobacter deserti TaxID=2282478 RepID=A0ABT4RIN3_9ACTN|nr:hypothetical protein [Solirubrobacter deserti]MDA0138409.1 hypothetical protein [Solirubrobacter deserti]
MSSLTPDLALAYVRELSADVRAGIVLDPVTGEVLAGDPRLAEPARELFAGHPHARELHGSESGAQVFAIRDGHRALVVLTGPHALPGPIRRDLRTALCGTAPESAQETPSARPGEALVKAVVTAAADAFRP